MSRPVRAACLLLAVAVTATGCGSSGQASSPSPVGAVPPLATSVVTADGAWAVVVMGGSAADHNNFWQIFSRPPGSNGWRLVTPPGVASNGGLVIAPAGGQSLTAGFRPSQALVITPLASTSNDGSSWSPAVLSAAIANVPDALAAAPGGSSLIALLTDGTAERSGPGANWAPLVTRRSLAASAAGTRCGLQQLTAAAISSSGVTLLAGACAHPGSAGIFARVGGTWSPAGPVPPAALARQPLTVLRLTRTASGILALLQAGTGTSASLLAAWSADSGSHWDLSAPFRLGGTQVAAASFGPGDAAAIVLSGNRGITIAGPGQQWHPLPALPSGTATLAAASGATMDALSVHGGRLTVWQTSPASSAWTQVQAIDVPIQYGSSG
jgi:hypothetical protein